MKKVSIRMPEAAPLGETFLEARLLAMVAAFFLNNPAGGWVDSVFTDRTHLLFVLLLWPLFIILPRSLIVSKLHGSQVHLL